ncbi:MAG: hypothetical protein WCI55_00955 [Armatimonadota bacterium]
MTNDPVSEFGQRLRKATKWRHHNDAVKEIVGHYQDLFQEALHKGASIDEARKFADENIGNVSEIAKGIRGGNGKSNGMKLQWIAMAVFVFGSLIATVMGMNGYEIGSLWGRVVEASDPIGLFAMYIAGFLAAVGILKAKRDAILGFCLAIILISVGHTAILLRHSRSFSRFDATWKRHEDGWHDYAAKYRPIMTERYNLYVAAISGTQQESDDAIRKLSSGVKRPQDRGVVILDGEKGKWIFPLQTQAVQARNIKVFPLRDDNLNWINFGATDTFEMAQREWRSSNELLKAIPILRKGSEAEFARASQVVVSTAMGTILTYVKICVLQFLYSFLITFLLFGIATKLRQLFKGNRRAI